MRTSSAWTRTILGLLCLYILLACIPAGNCASQDSATRDAEEIQNLLNSVASGSIRPAAALDPQLTGEARANDLALFGQEPFEMMLKLLQPVTLTGTGSATAVVAVHFKSENTEVESSEREVRFVKRNGNWYFADFDFLKFSGFLIVVLIVGSSVGVAYASTVLLIGRKLIHGGDYSGMNRVRLFIPFYWPGLFRGR